MDEQDHKLDEQAIALAEAALGSSFDGYQRDIETMHELIEMRLTQILEHQFGRLPQILYHMDVPEREVEAAFAAAESSADVPARLARLVVSRLDAISRSRGHDSGEDP